jgi:putative protein kinase ArgK-like GTPase of G3E family
MIPEIARLVRSMLAGDKQSLARLISLAEDDSPYFPEILEILRPPPGQVILPVMTTQAINDVGIEELYQAIEEQHKNC